MTNFDFYGLLQFDQACGLTKVDLNFQRWLGLLRSATFLLCQVKRDRIIRRNGLPSKVAVNDFRVIGERVYGKLTPKNLPFLRPT